MESLRECIAILLFIIGATVLGSMFSSGFKWDELLLGLSCFVVSYFMWPSKKRGKREGESPILDIIELVIELPVEIFIWVVRLIGRIISGLFSNKDGGVDIDF